MKKFYFILTLICLFSCSLLISFNVFAQDGAPDGTHGSVSYNQKNKTMNFFMEAGQEAGQLFYGLGEDIVNGIDNAYAIYLYQFVDEDDLSMGEKQLIQHFCDIDEGNESASIIFDIDDSFNFTLKDEYKADYDALINKLIDSINNQYVLYNTYSLDDCSKFFAYSDINFSTFQTYINSNFDSSDYPLACYRSLYSFYGAIGLSNMPNGYTMDGLICQDSSNFHYICEYWDTFQIGGYYNNVSGVPNAINFQVYSDSHLVNRDFKGSWNSNPIRLTAYKYANRGNLTEDVLFFISQDGSPIMFFRDTQCYSNFYSNKSSIPLTWNNLNVDIPENFDYSDFFKNIDDDIIKNTKDLEELYTYISSQLQDSIDRINDSLKDTNSVLKEIRDLIGDKWDRQFGRNILDYLPDIVDKLDDIFWDVHALNPDNVQQLTETILQDSSLENRLKHIFPFGVFQDLKDLSEVFARLELKELVFTFTTEHFYWGADSGETSIEINISELPAFNVVKSMINFFVICLFNYSMARIEFKFVSMFFGG